MAAAIPLSLKAYFPTLWVSTFLSFWPISPPAVRETGVQYERCLGDSELSYYLPSRADGVNDMYLHLGLRAPEHLMQHARVSTVWAILRVRHPLLASRIVMHDYEDVRFVYTSPGSSQEALKDASKHLQYSTLTKDELIDSYLNGPRTLSNERLSYLIVSQPKMEKTTLEGETDRSSPTVQFELLICAAHFLGDGMALHQFANDFFTLLGSGKSLPELDALLNEEWQQRWGRPVEKASALPSCLEDKLPPFTGGRFRRAACQVDFKNSQGKLIGGQAFPKRSKQPCRTNVSTVPFDAELTKGMLKNCKAHGVSISAALFAICNLAWSKTSTEKWEMPTMMYSALNLRPYFSKNVANDSYWFLAVGYFNVILPTFFPRNGDLSATFWHRARLAKEQSTRAAKSPMVVSRSREMAKERGKRARAWAKEDDDKERGVWKAPPPKAGSAPPITPSTALIGLSLLGNLDGIYKHATFPDIQLHTLTTGSRQRSGSMLLFGYTFAGKLWVSLGYDENGFEKEVVDRFWIHVLEGIKDFLVI